MLKTRRSEYVASKWVRHWLSQFGAPARITHDQGGEFEKGFVAMLEEYSLPTTVTGAHAGWQLSLGERHGGLLGLIVETVIMEHNCEGYKALKDALAAAVGAKNHTVSRDGYTPNQRLFGQDVRFPGLTDEEERLGFAEALGTEGEVAKANRLRLTARTALLRSDVQEKLRRSMLRRPAKSVGPYVPGSQIYFWVPRKAQRRYASGTWRGPATVLVREGQKRYFVSWRGRCLLLAEENMRLATGEELALQSPVPHQDLKDLARVLKDPEGNRGYEDSSSAAAPPQPVPPPPRADKARQFWRAKGQAMLKGLRSAKRLIGQLPYRATPAPKRRKMLRDGPRPAAIEPPMLSQAREPLQLPGVRARALENPPWEDSPVPDVSPVPTTPLDDGDGEAPDASGILDEELQEIEVRRARALDDVPISVKRKLGSMTNGGDAEGPEAKKMRTAFVFALASIATDPEGPQNEWLSRYEIGLLRSLTGLDVTSARLHRVPRKRMQMPTKFRNRARTSILIGEDPAVTFIVEENASEVAKHPKKKAPFLWTGLTILHRPAAPEVQSVYVELPGGLVEAKMDSEKAQEFQALWTEEVKDLLVADALLLRLKENKKELDPKFFDEEEQKAFDEADKKEWKQWLNNKVVKFLTPEQAAKVPKSKIFRAPMRMVRVNKSAEKLAPLVAKSRLIIPGHLDPEIGTYRTDSPTAATMTTRLLKLVASSRKYKVYSFDVSTAFLSGKATEREIYVRAPPGGLPKVQDFEPHRKIMPLELMQVLKSAYGLTESPRLWYLEASEGLNEVGLKELAASRSVFMAAEKGETWALCALHVDDGLLVGSDQDQRFVELRKKIDKRFNIKEWQYLEEKKPLTFLGVELRKEADGSLSDRMDRYISQIEAPEAPKGKPDEPLNAAQITTLRRLIMKMRWPAQHTMPQVLYLVSKLSQQVNHATVATFQEGLKVLKLMKQESSEGRARLNYKSIPEKRMVIATFFDASLGKEDQGKSQLGAVHFVADQDLVQGPSPACVVEFSSTKSTRVVRSSMAAEACSMSLAADKHLYIRLLLWMLRTGDQTVVSNWREQLRMKGYMITDAKSLFDHMTSTGQIPSERQTLLDLLICKELEEKKIILMRWVPTTRQFADFLTKAMAPVLWDLFMRSNQISLKETPAEAVEEEHRKGIRKAQRERRKERMKKTSPKTLAAPSQFHRSKGSAVVYSYF